MTRLRVIDLETTGIGPPAEIIEFGRADVVAVGGIPPETKAVHHITEADFDDQTPVCTPERLRQAVWGGETPDVLVAHNAEFERQFVTPEVTDGLPWICTYKVALLLWPDAPRHSNQVLRYWRELVIDSAYAMPPHRAGPDAWVTAHVLVELLKETTIEQMIAWTEEPKYLPAIPFGKHRGVKWAEAPADYLQWMVRQTDMDRDALAAVERELLRRRSASG